MKPPKANYCAVYCPARESCVSTLEGATRSQRINTPSHTIIGRRLLVRQLETAKEEYGHDVLTSVLSGTEVDEHNHQTRVEALEAAIKNGPEAQKNVRNAAKLALRIKEQLDVVDEAGNCRGVKLSRTARLRLAAGRVLDIFTAGDAGYRLLGAKADGRYAALAANSVCSQPSIQASAETLATATVGIDFGASYYDLPVAALQPVESLSE